MEWGNEWDGDPMRPDRQLIDGMMGILGLGGIEIGRNWDWEETMLLGKA